MSEEREGPPTPPSKRLARKGGSGEHEIVIAFRKKLDSIEENSLPALVQELKNMDEAIASSIPPPPNDTPIPPTERAPPSSDKK